LRDTDGGRDDRSEDAMLIEKTIIASIYDRDDHDIAWAIPEGMILYDVRLADKDDGEYDHKDQPMIIRYGTLADIVATVPGCRFIPATEEAA
jgi:hypothetical protein